VEFGKADRNLLVRVGRCLKEQADDLERSCGADWSLDADHVQAKKDHDRLRREERDLAAFRKRLEALVVPQQSHQEET